MSAERQLKIALKLTGASFETGVEETFYFSNSGFTASIAGDTQERYYEPLIKSSILLERRVGDKDDSISIQLINKGLNYLTNYLFNGYSLELYISANFAPSSTNWYPIFLGSSKSVMVQKGTVTVQATTHFDVFTNSINPEVFSGVRGDYEGDPVLQGVTKPRLFGKVFNVTPVLLRSDNLVYGCNWDYDGLRTSVLGITSVRDGGVVLSPTVDYLSTYEMDAGTPPSPGFYATCLAEGTIKLGSSPVYGVTIDVTQGTQTITDFIQMMVIELGLVGYIIHDAPNYTFGLYVDSLLSYNNLLDNLLENLDIAYWFDGQALLNVKSVRGYKDQEQLVRFIDAGQDFIDDQDIVVFNIDRVDYTLPPKQVQVGYKKNHTPQSQDQLAGLTNQEDKEPYKNEYLYESKTLRCNQDLYKNLESVEYNTLIQNEEDASTEVSQWIGVRTQINDTLEVTCPILSANSFVILGVIIDPNTDYLNISSSTVLISDTTYLISHNNANYSGQKNLEMGDTVIVNSFYFDYDDEKFVVYGVYIDTKKMQVTYTLAGLRSIAACVKNVLDDADNVIDGTDNIVDDF